MSFKTLLILGLSVLLLGVHLGAAAAEEDGSSPREVDTVNDSNNETEGEIDPEAVEREKQLVLKRGYAKQFRIKRSEQMDAAMRILEKTKYTMRYDLTKVVVDEMFRILRQAQKDLKAAGVLVDHKFDKFPEKDEEIGPLVKVLENMAFFSDLALRLPDIIHRMTDDHEVRLGLIVWGAQVCANSFVYQEEENHMKMIDLMMQEMKLADEIDPNFVNPYHTAAIERNIKEAQDEQKKLEALEKKRRRKERLRKPRMGGDL